MLPDKASIKTKYLTIIKQIWLEADDQFPAFLKPVSEATKSDNEQYSRKLSKDFNIQVNRFPRFLLGRKRWKRRMLSLIEDVLRHETVIGIHQSMKESEIASFREELMVFLKQVRAFAPELELEGIGQALRNYIVYVMFKYIHRIQSGFSMAGFGYSMLYPFTDNYIDSRSYTAGEKVEYNRLIRDKIEGRPVHPGTAHQRKTCDLLDAIFLNFDHSVSRLLLMMLEAQEESLRQQDNGVALTDEECLDISLYKGGISVLVDRYLIGKELNEEEIIFYLGLGFFLQLADDLQDIKSDSEQGWQTLLTLNISHEYEERYINKLLHFIHTVMSSYQAENNGFKDFILANCYQLVLTSVIGSKEYFSQDYIDAIGRYLPVTVAFYEEMQRDMIYNQNSRDPEQYLKLMDVIIK